MDTNRIGDKSTHRIENHRANSSAGGAPTHRRTLEALKKALEDPGVVFIDPVDGVAGPGVRLKWEVYQSQSTQGATGTSPTDGFPDTSQAEAWDDGIEALHDASVPSATDPEIEELRTYWRTNPEKWAAMHKSTRWAILGRDGAAATLSSPVSTGRRAWNYARSIKTSAKDRP